ncbi:DUF5107 domain-containing protein [Alginatibacterium sediminis]|uniref:DUF5107 domain-containing protein n=1 Tax=Alginatibacterium sediminis TaxID=2164068 RepID=A0A420E5M3_9ALTE|nr:DUF5107 domain-containing protein [Alginatibacterium sediminis]RKF13152.1 DUF5107 domain-containing protein [Alginatibacterium sediminis]
MSSVVSHGSFKGVASVILENGLLRCEWLPEYGSKLCSLKRFDGENWRELLWQSGDEQFKIPNYADDFSQYDSSGFDECFPTINRCDNLVSPALLQHIPDHGEVWALAWKLIELSSSQLVFEVKSPKLGYTLSKSVRLEKDKLLSSYHVDLAASAPRLPFVWTPHALFQVFPRLQLEVPSHMQSITNTFDGCPSLGIYESQHPYPVATAVNGQSMDFSLLRSQSSNTCEKYYFDSLLQADDSFGFSDEYHQVVMQVDAATVPYLGIWKNQGAYKGDLNFALEPCSGIYDAVDDAYTHQRCAIIEPGQSAQWYFNIQVKAQTSN